MENNNYRGNSYSDNDSRANNRGSRPYGKPNFHGNGGYNNHKNFGNRRNFNNSGSNDGNYQPRNNYRSNYNSDNNGENSENNGYRSNYNRGGYNNENRGNYNSENRGNYNSENRGNYNSENRESFTNNNTGRQHFRRSSGNSNGGFNRGNSRPSYGNRGGNYGNNNGNFGNNNYRKNYNQDGNSNGDFQERRPHFSKSGPKFTVDEQGYRHKRYWDHSDRKQQAFEQAAQSEDDVMENDGKIRLNKYLANSGMCSRREADRMIKAGMVQVNGVVVTEMGVKVNISDEVKYNDLVVKPEHKRYLLLNKPKDYITTLKDPHARNTVMELIEGACKERVYPVGRLDRNTTGVLLFTNDGDLAKKLTHPSNEIQKIYHVTLDKAVAEADLEKIAQGFDLEDGFIQADEVAYVDGEKTEVGIRIHSGRNRIVRRIFEALGYDVKKLDRVMFAGLDKKGLGRGRWRYLSDREIGFLNMISTKKTNDTEADLEEAEESED